ncbi:ATP-binding protein [Streptomyces sp. NPDC046939]|uniref:ATP-binding protein n=1 Tax=Streptomyces sp. NPDC046939 TaxID=3155376 RepID=UPI0033E9E249
MELVTYWFRCTAEPRAVPEGRKFAANVLRDWGFDRMTDSVTQIVSELVTNAVQATGTTDIKPSHLVRETLPVVAVRLRVTGARLVVEVYDTGRTLPKMRTPEPDALGGRGLPLVTLLSERWDSHRHPAGGKVVYAVLPLVSAPVTDAGAESEPPPEVLPGWEREPSGKPEVRPDAALLTRLERLLELRFRGLVALGR